MRPIVTLSPGQRLHFMGIGGIGMSGLASICLARGCAVSGCDSKQSGTSRRLQAQGADVSVGHDPAHLDNVEVLVHSSAVQAKEPELAEARSRGIAVISRGELLAAVAQGKQLIGVAGAHGKTTTSGLAAQLLTEAQWDPTVVVGGMMLSYGTNARAGHGAFVVAETDESDGSFLQLCPDAAIITNIDREHLNHYQTFERLVEAFQQFASQISPRGALIGCYDDPVVRAGLGRSPDLTFGFGDGADLTAEQIILSGHGSRFQVRYHGRSLGRFSLQIPGRHNVSNALGVIGLGLILHLPVITISEALAGFRGTGRRFQVTQLPGDIQMVEDYAHHPSEIKATLAADPSTHRHRLVVFQPHRFSRTQLLERELTMCFDRADGVIVTDIYGAFESPIPGISGERLAELIRQHGHPFVRYVAKQDLSSFVTRIARAGDTIFFLGAGDIGELCHDVADRLRTPARTAC
jgi:UDP-N-acetylmuramate--alanine ligase